MISGLQTGLQHRNVITDNTRDVYNYLYISALAGSPSDVSVQKRNLRCKIVPAVQYSVTLTYTPPSSVFHDKSSSMRDESLTHSSPVLSPVSMAQLQRKKYKAVFALHLLCVSCALLSWPITVRSTTITWC